MKLKYLGTGAAEGIPAIFCECDTCKKARKLGGRNIRTRSQAIVDDRLLVDFPPDTYAHFLRSEFPLARIKACIVTHSHSDHLYPVEIEMRMANYSNIENKEPLTFYSDKSAYDMLSGVIKNYEIKDDEVRCELIAPYQPFDADGYTVTAIRASHDPRTTPVVYLIEKDDKSMFYVNDTSDFCDEAWEHLSKFGKKLDLVSFDCTAGTLDITYIGHMNIPRCNAMRDKLKSIGIADEHTIFVLNHFSHNGGNTLYDDMAEIAKEHGYTVAYDGLEIEF